jgi:hypothetical protein
VLGDERRRLHAQAFGAIHAALLNEWENIIH